MHLSTVIFKKFNRTAQRASFPFCKAVNAVAGTENHAAGTKATFSAAQI